MTCYLSSVLQMLAAVPEFCTALMGHKSDEDTSIPAALQQLIVSMYVSRCCVGCRDSN